MASKLLAMASSLIAIASNLLAMASKLLAMATNLLSMTYPQPAKGPYVWSKTLAEHSTTYVLYRVQHSSTLAFYFRVYSRIQGATGRHYLNLHWLKSGKGP